MNDALNHAAFREVCYNFRSDPMYIWQVKQTKIPKNFIVTLGWALLILSSN